jgi:hypothetical protein
MGWKEQRRYRGCIQGVFQQTFPRREIGGNRRILHQKNPEKSASINVSTIGINRFKSWMTICIDYRVSLVNPGSNLTKSFTAFPIIILSSISIKRIHINLSKLDIIGSIPTGNVDRSHT